MSQHQQQILAILFLFPLVVSSLMSIPRSSRYGTYSNIDSSDEIVEVKRYDRNCFFSPVQCMLNFNDDNRFPVVVATKKSNNRGGNRGVESYSNLQ